MESLKGSMSELMTLFHDRMSKFEAELQKAPPSTHSTCDMAADFASFKGIMIEALNCLQCQMEALARDVDALEMRGRRKILLIHGIEEKPKEDTAKVVVAFVRDRLKLDFSENLIRRCHRMGHQTAAGRSRPILLKLQEMDVRDNIWYAKTKLKGSGITLSEFLTRSRHQVFMAAREKFGIASCWTKQGYIYVLASDGTRHRVVSFVELNTIAVPKPDAEKVAPASAPRRQRAATKK